MILRLWHYATWGDWEGGQKLQLNGKRQRTMKEIEDMPNQR